MIAPALARTPRRLVHQEGSLRLYRYGRSGKPVLLVYSWINRPTVLDLLPDRSVVRSLLDAGLDPWLADWGDPGQVESTLDLGDHVERLARAARVIGRPALLGYCLGGVASLLLAALEPPLVSRVALLATPVVFEQGGTLATWARSSNLDPAALARTETGNVPGEVLREIFRWLDPVGQVRKWVTLAERSEDRAFLEAFLAQETWANGCVDFPGRLYADFIALYREDRLAKGELVLGGRPARLDAIAAPILSVISPGDRIVPEESSRPLESLVGRGLVRTLEVPGGHIGMTTGKRARETTHRALGEFFHA